MDAGAGGLTLPVSGASMRNKDLVPEAQSAINCLRFSKSSLRR